MKEKITIKEIAEISGVSKSTISRYFNGGYVKEETQKKISEVIEQYNYEPSTLAKMMKAKKTNVIGIVVPTLKSITSSRCLMALDKTLLENGYTSMIVNTDHSDELEIRSIERLAKFNVDGIIVLASNITLNHEEAVKNLNVPVVFIGQKIDNAPYIIYDDYHAGYTIGEYVGKCGHKNITYVGVNEKDEAVGITRKKGVMDGLKQYNANMDHFIETTFSFTNSVKLLDKELLNHVSQAVICATDNIAIACYKILSDAGYKIPEEISIASFGGYDFTQILEPHFATIRFDNEKAGVCAANKILAMINDKPYAKETLIGYEFYEGNSVNSKD